MFPAYSGAQSRSMKPVQKGLEVVDPLGTDQPSKTTNGWFVLMCCLFAASLIKETLHLTLGPIIGDRTGKCDGYRFAFAAL